MNNEIAFKPDVAMEAATRADFTYKITPNTITITDTTIGKLSREQGIDAVWRKLSTGTKARSLCSKSCIAMNTGFWNGVRWNGQSASFFALYETNQKKAMPKLLSENAE